MSFLATTAINVAKPIAEQQGHRLVANFSHHVEPQIQTTVQDQVRAFSNTYSAHPTKLTVSSTPISNAVPAQFA
eukprot:m.239877 g.239877  ORF g.239877 m.239877 type:complete len:74 (-) comp26265_c5_seq11:128-349(-)